MSTWRKELGRYRIDDTLGRGGMAVVHLGYDADLHRPVAIKLLADNLAQDDAFRARFLREARLAARLNHPNVVQVFDIGQDVDQRPFIVMEFVEGETLADTIGREGRLGPARVIEIGRQCCAGLAYAHNAGLIHRDIKPQNLLVATDGTVKLADFGVARALDQTQLTETGSILGTARYLAPEQAAGKPVTAAADIYSLGVVLYELLAGKTPFDGRSLTELVIAQREQAVAPLGAVRAEVPAQLDAAVLRCLAPAAGDRPSADALATILGDTDTGVQLAGRRPPDPRPLAETRVLTDAPTRVRRATPAGIHLRRVSFDPRWRWIAVALVGALAIGLAALALSAGGTHSTKPAPPTTPTGTTPAQHAEHLANWIRAHTHP